MFWGKTFINQHEPHSPFLVKAKQASRFLSVAGCSIRWRSSASICHDLISSCAVPMLHNLIVGPLKTLMPNETQCLEITFKLCALNQYLHYHLQEEKRKKGRQSSGGSAVSGDTMLLEIPGKLSQRCCSLTEFKSKPCTTDRNHKTLPIQRQYCALVTSS